MKTYKRIYSDVCPDGTRYVDSYVCKEWPRITIEVERGALSHNRPTGYTLKFDGNTDFTDDIVSYTTLWEARQWADYYFPGI